MAYPIPSLPLHHGHTRPLDRYAAEIGRMAVV
jgi:hypothetical protein